ncbi:ParB/RepB/Spo0J family partition protein [Candidatus Kaiserbacteria bacterium]|nr:ParB/RepB/Spo0J family partition protein [Candidatus Kaiserbacteria bacterium]
MSFQGDSIFWVEVEKIVPNPFQPRREFDELKLKELSESIRMYGILQPLTVTRREIVGEDGSFRTEYELIAGERRLRASKLAGIEQVPVIIRSGEQTEQEKLELAIIENLQREDLNAVDRALAFRQLADVFNLSHLEVAKKVGRSRMYVSNTIRLLGLPDYMLSSLRTGDITEGHARTLLMLKDRPEELDVVYREILLKKLSVREVERIARKIATDKVRKKTWEKTDAGLIEIERAFTDTLGTRVQISKTDFGGKLTIDYFSEDDLKKLLSMIKSQGKITEFNDSSEESEEGEESDSVVIQKMTEATPLEAVSDNEDKESDSITKEAIESEEAVSEVIEDMVVDGANYAGSYKQLTNATESVTKEPEFPVPASDYVAKVNEVETEPVALVPDDSRYRYEEQQWQYKAPETVLDESESESSVVETGSAVRVHHSDQKSDLSKVSNTVNTDSLESNSQADGISAEPNNTEKKPEDDSSLYSIRNFSL